MDLGDCGGEIVGKWMNAMNSKIQTHMHKSGLSSLARTTNTIEFAGKDLSVEFPTKRLSNPDRIPKSKRSTKDRVAKQKIFKLIELLEWERTE